MPPLASEHPYALQAAGRLREAAAAWQAAGYPYEHAAALAESPDPQDRLAALAQLDALGPRRWPGWSGPGCAGWASPTFPADRSGPPGRTRPGSPSGRSRCWGCSARDAPTPRSPTGWCVHPDGRQPRRRRAGQARRRDPAGRGRQAADLGVLDPQAR